MRALTMEEVGWVAGGSPFSETERDVGNEMVLVGTAMQANQRTKAVGSAFITVGTVLQMDANRREQQEVGSGGGGSGGSGEGGGPPPTNGGVPGGYTDPRGGGGVRPRICYGPTDCHDAGQGSG